MQMLTKIGGNQNQSCRSVIKTLLPKEQTWGQSEYVHRDERFLSLAQIYKLHHELKWNMLIKRAHWAFYWPKYACTNLADVCSRLVNLLVHGTCLDYRIYWIVSRGL